MTEGEGTPLRVYSETLPFAEVVRPRTLALLARYRLELVLAVRPWDLPELPGVAQRLRGAGVPLSVWPMLADDDGRWASVHNVPAFARFLAAIMGALGPSPLAGDLLVDLEPPIGKARSLVALGDPSPEHPVRLRGPDGLGRLASGIVRPSGWDAKGRELARAVAGPRAQGLTTSLAVWPFVALDTRGNDGWQYWLGTPVDALDAAHVSVMIYTSIFEGWSRGALRRRDALALLAAATGKTVRRWGARAGISLGCVGTGAFDDEPVYRGPSELAEDAAIARAAGCSRLSLFDLGGVLARAPAEAWLEAFTSGAPAVTVPSSRRVRAAGSLARAATWVLGRLPARG
jgi:hypothetical protein